MEPAFRHCKPNRDKLRAYGFVQQDGAYTYSAPLVSGHMRLTITVRQDDTVHTQVIDCLTGDEYVLHRVPTAVGAFVGQVKQEYEALLEQVAAQCFDPDVFQSDSAQSVMAYARERYGDELEFLWKRFPENAILRRKDTGKWYGALLTISKRKLGMPSDDRIEILDLRLPPEDIALLVDGVRYFPGYHMNKKHWYTLCLDGTIPVQEICRRVDISYQLATI